MSEIEKENSGLDKSTRKTLTFKKMNGLEALTDTANDEKSVEGLGTAKVNKAAKKKESRSLSDILLESFAVRQEKDGKVKQARITKADLKALCALARVEPINQAVIESLYQSVEITDPELNCLTEIALGVMDAQNAELEHFVLDTSVRIASGMWIHKHRGSLDLYQDIFDKEDDVLNPLSYLAQSLDTQYQKRLYAAGRGQSNYPKSEANANNDLASVSAGGDHLQDLKKITRVLKSQKNNLLIIGVFWLIKNNHIDLVSALKFLSGLVDTKTSNRKNLKNGIQFIAQQCTSPDSRFVQILAIHQDEVKHLKENRDQLKSQVQSLDHQNFILNENIASQALAAEQVKSEVADLRSEIDLLNQSLNDQQLDERAKRTHLRDSEGQVRARAFNLLSEEVLAPLRLSLSALQREKPKTEVAAHHIELAVEHIERDLKWFKE